MTQVLPPSGAEEPGSDVFIPRVHPRNQGKVTEVNLNTSCCYVRASRPYLTSGKYSLEKRREGVGIEGGNEGYKYSGCCLVGSEPWNCDKGNLGTRKLVVTWWQGIQVARNSKTSLP